MHKRQKQWNPSGIKWPTGVDMPLNKTHSNFCLKKKWSKVGDLCWGWTEGSPYNSYYTKV